MAISRLFEVRRGPRVTLHEPGRLPAHRPAERLDRLTPVLPAPKVVLDPQSQPSHVEAALARARALLDDGAAAAARVENGLHEALNDSRDGSGARGRLARAELFDNGPLEAAALRFLQHPDRSQYVTVKAGLLQRLGRSGGDALGALALQTLLLDGGWPGVRAVGSADTVASALERLATQPLGEGLDRQHVLSVVAQVLASPRQVLHAATASSGAAELQLLLSRPAEYVRLVAGLASAAGRVTTAGGDVLVRDPSALHDDTRGNVSQRLLGPALARLSEAGPGTARLLRSLTGLEFAIQEATDTAQKAQGAALAIEQVQQGTTVVVGLRWPTASHAVVLRGVEERPGGRAVHIVNPWGREETLARAEFQERLVSVYTATGG